MASAARALIRPRPSTIRGLPLLPRPRACFLPPALTDELCKLFVGGIAWDTTVGSLQSYFSGFGEVIDCNIVRTHLRVLQRGTALRVPRPP